MQTHTFYNTCLLYQPTYSPSPSPPPVEHRNLHRVLSLHFVPFHFLFSQFHFRLLRSKSLESSLKFNICATIQRFEIVLLRGFKKLERWNT